MVKPMKSAPKKAPPKKAPAKKAPAKKAPAKKAPPKKAPAKKAPAPKAVAPKTGAPKAAAPGDLALPSWATKKPEGGFLPVPGTLKDAITKALGPSDRKYGITHSVRMGAVLMPPATWGLHRMLSVADGAGPEVARVLEVLAQHELPLVAADFWYPSETDDTGTVEGATALFEAALAPASVTFLRRLTVLLHRVRLEAPLARVLARAVARMSSLEVLGLNATGGAGALSVVEACAPLRSLSLRDLGGPELAALARLPALEKLEALALNGIDADDAALATLLRAPWAKKLRSLELAKKLLLPADYRAVAALPELTSLNLRFPDEASVAAIADAAFVPRLTRLELHDCRIDLGNAKRLAAQGLPALERLYVKHAEMSDAALKAIVDAAPSLKELGIPKTTKPQPWSKRGRTVL